MPLQTCSICYRKFAQEDLNEISWAAWVTSGIPKPPTSPFSCEACFSPNTPILGCRDCIAELGKGSLTSVAQIHCYLRCEHVYPAELNELTLIEEKLIALNSCFGLIARYNIPEGGGRQSLQYPRHIKGHITVFPNNVQDVVTRVLPHPLIKVLSEIHISWHGPQKPAPRDLSKLLSVRRRVVERALV
ncbi:hypothetical protein BKA56DRAFT_569411 [Ilyonectria sp. MPI-CAGE-AT-0026]|nr:hypothetical protein BKA56DRAFT_569411 [Ilyonectria sp. MPI-CAGE-AT-0026]